MIRLADRDPSQPIPVGEDRSSASGHHRLTSSDAFCIIPWLHLHAHPNGRAFPCCMSDMSQPVGDLRREEIPEIWNSDGMRRLRLDLLADRKPSTCRKCHESETSGFFSKRLSSNEQLGHHIDLVESTDDHGRVAELRLAYLDIRFSNVCNLGCRSCGPLFSSRLYDDHRKLTGRAPDHPRVMHAGGDPDAMWRRLEPYLEGLEKITFGGGEPLIMEEHYRLLRELVEREMFHVKLFYHTNLTVLNYKGLDVLDIWRRFEEVHVSASLDAMGDAAAVMRHGTKWDDIEANRLRMLRTCPNLHFIVGPTLGLINALHLPDFHQQWVERGLIEPSQFELSVLQEPTWQRIDALPGDMKRAVDSRYRDHIDWLSGRGAGVAVADSFRSALEFMNKNDRSHELSTFVSYTLKMDQMRNQDTFAVLPELEGLRSAVRTQRAAMVSL